MFLFKRISFFLLFACASLLSYAQQETTLPFLTWAPQAGYADLTIKPDQYKTSVAIPVLGSFQMNFFNSGFTFNNLVNSSNVADPNKVIPHLKRLNYVHAGVSYDIANVRFGKEKTFYQISLRDVYSNRFYYTKDMVNMLWNGNASYAGQYADLSGTRISQNAYHELAFGITKEINSKLTVGVRGKLLFGIANITTQKSETSLYTNPDGLSLSGHSNIVVHTSGYSNTDQFSGSQFFGFANKGLGLDLGARYQLTEKLSVACNATNLGFIHWKGNVMNYTVNGDYTYTGYVMRDSADVVNADWQNVLDTLQAVFQPVKTTKAYNSWLTPMIYLSGTYKLRDDLSVYASLASDFYHAYLPTFTIGGVYNLGKTLQATLNYSVVPDKYFNIGGGLVARGGPVQYFVLCDNLVAIFDPYNSRYFNFRTGINLVFGKVTKAEE